MSVIAPQLIHRKCICLSSSPFYSARHALVLFIIQTQVESVPVLFTQFT